MLRLSVEQLLLDKRIEQYKVQARNGYIVVESNRPLLRNKGLKHRKPDWKAMEANGLNTYVLEKIYKAIQEQVDK